MQCRHGSAAVAAASVASQAVAAVAPQAVAGVLTAGEETQPGRIRLAIDFEKLEFYSKPSENWTLRPGSLCFPSDLYKGHTILERRSIASNHLAAISRQAGMQSVALDLQACEQFLGTES